MVYQPQRERMACFLIRELEVGGYKVIGESTSAKEPYLLVRPVDESDQFVYIFLHAGGDRTIAQVEERSRMNNRTGLHTAHVFFKDGESSMVRLRDSRYAASGRHDFRSLKLYNDREIDRMIKCRDLEVLVAHAYGDKVTYYQPETRNLSESIRTYHLVPVKIDYDHVDTDHPAYDHAKGKTMAKTYRLPEEIDRGDHAHGLRLSLAERPPLRARVVPGRSKQKWLFAPKEQKNGHKANKQLVLFNMHVTADPVTACNA